MLRCYCLSGGFDRKISACRSRRHSCRTSSARVHDRDFATTPCIPRATGRAGHREAQIDCCTAHFVDGPNSGLAMAHQAAPDDAMQLVMSALGQKRTLKKRKPECPNYPLARQSSILSAASSQASANSKNSFLAAGSSAASASFRYSTACSR